MKRAKLRGQIPLRQGHARVEVDTVPVVHSQVAHLGMEPRDEPRGQPEVRDARPRRNELGVSRHVRVEAVPVQVVRTDADVPRERLAR
jgi:hypothetical protein